MTLKVQRPLVVYLNGEPLGEIGTITLTPIANKVKPTIAPMAFSMTVTTSKWWKWKLKWWLFKAALKENFRFWR